MREGSEKILRMAAAFKAGQAVPVEMQKWFVQSTERFLRGEPMEQAFDVIAETKNGRRAHTEAGIEARNEALRLAREKYFPGLPPGAAAEKIRAELNRYYSTSIGWKAHAKAKICPSALQGSIRELCWHILNLTPNHAPLSQRRLTQILETSAAYSFPADAIIVSPAKG